MVTICSPFKGSPIAEPPFTYSDSVKQMRQGTEFLFKLRDRVLNGTEDRAPNNYLCFGASKDFFVRGENYHPYEDATERENVVMLHAKQKGHGHLSIMSSHEIVRRIGQHIGAVTAPPAEAAPPQEAPMIL